MSDPLRTSVIVPSAGRPADLDRCLTSLAAQTVLPLEIVVVWQADDLATKDSAERWHGTKRLDVRVVHSERRGIVPAENVGLSACRGEIIMLIDDDATAPPTWIAQHLSHYRDASVGAVGGPIRNYSDDGTPYPTRRNEPVGRLALSGRVIGNTHDHPAAWSSRPATDVDHLAGSNLSFRRSALTEFEAGLKPYWQLFELDACLQVHASDKRVVFDFGNAIDHYPSASAYAGGRDGDLTIKVFNSAYNHAFILAKHSRGAIRMVRLAYLIGVGSVGAPGKLGWVAATVRYGHPLKELGILARTIVSHLQGWRAGTRVRTS